MTIIEADVDPFGNLYDEHVGTVFRYFYLRKGNRKLAEHLTSETFHRALGHPVFTDVDVEAGPWLIGLARQVAVDYERRWPGEHAPVDLPAEQDNLEMIAALWRLLPRHQDVLILRYLMGFTLEQAAQAMGKSETAVRLLGPRAVQALARHLPEGFQP